MRAIGRRFPRAGDRLENVIRDATANLSALARDRRVLTESLTWASLNWILDAASLWCFVAAFGRFVNPVELFAAYGIANVAGALPVTPAGLGVVDSVTPLLLVSFGVTRNVATLGVLGWRLVNFWMPIPAGALAYATLKVPRGAGLGAMRQAVSGMMSRGDTAGERPPPRPASPRSTSVNPEGTSVNPDGTSVRSDGTAAGPDGTSVRSEDGTSVTPPGRADGSAAQAGSGHDTAGGPARGDSVFGDAP
jgi:hypothetical protein